MFWNNNTPMQYIKIPFCYSALKVFELPLISALLNHHLKYLVTFSQVVKIEIHLAKKAFNSKRYPAPLSFFFLPHLAGLADNLLLCDDRRPADQWIHARLVTELAQLSVSHSKGQNLALKSSLSCTNEMNYLHASRRERSMQREEENKCIWWKGIVRWRLGTPTNTCRLLTIPVSTEL